MTVLVHSLILLLCVPCKPRMVDCTVVHQLHHSGQMTFEVCLRRHCHTQEIMFTALPATLLAQMIVPSII